MNSQDRSKIQLLNLVLNGGVIEFKVPLYRDIWNIKVLRAIKFTQEIKEEHTLEEWNLYCNLIRKTIGVKTYCEWIRNSNSGKIKGILAAYDQKGREIKLKYFQDWIGIIRKIKELSK